jgi:inorganic pyrophosphatase
VLKLLDREEPDDKILSVPMNDPYWQDTFDLADVPAHFLREIEHFFKSYKDLEGKRVQAGGWGGRDEAKRVIVDSIKRYDEAYLAAGP